MHTLFLLNPTAGKTDCTQQLPQQINAAAARAGLAPEEYTIRITTHAGHARELARAAAKPGDIIILSPASASFDLYPNFEVRGREFKKIVNALK